MVLRGMKDDIGTPDPERKGSLQLGANPAGRGAGTGLKGRVC